MKRASAPSYDLFKTIVTVILVLILLLMLLRGCATLPAAPAPAETLASSPVATEAVLAAGSAETESASPMAPTEEPTGTPTAAPSPTPTSAATEPLPTEVSSPTPATAPPATDASTPTLLATVETPATTPVAGTAESASCATSAPSRLSVGQTARVTQRLNMRSDASITASLIQVNPTNTQVEVIGGPVCTPVGERAYLWWQIRLADGTEGWSAEMQLNSPSYFLEPVQ